MSAAPSSPDGGPSGGPDPAQRLLETVQELVLELRPERRERGVRVRLSSRLDRDLGIDSLGRTELLIRLERAFNVRLPEQTLAQAETLHDLLAAVQRENGRASAPAGAPIRTAEIGPAEPAPSAAATLPEALDWHSERHGDRLHAKFLDARGFALSYAELSSRARRLAAGLLAQGVEPGGRVALMLPTGVEFFEAFFGILYAGAIAVPIYPPARPSQIEEHLRRQAAILNNAGAALLITAPEARGVAALLKTHVSGLRGVETVESVRGDHEAALPETRDGSALAMLQYTSGSTGQPKGVMLTHANLLANLRAMGQAAQPREDDVLVSWLPLYHDMGLIGAWLGSLYYAMPLAIMSPLTFLARPEKWLWAIHEHRGTISAGPNFAFELCLRKIGDARLEGLDLSSLRMLMSGAEPVSADTLRRFTAKFSSYGLQADCLAPVYGLAENSLGLAFPRTRRAPRADRIRRDALSRRGEAVPAEPEEPGAMEVVSCGEPVPGHEIRIVDTAGRELGERREGALQFRGPSATSGYYRNPEATRKLLDGDWLNSGDRAYIAQGEVYITGRSKDIIIRAGRNIYPQEVEEAVGAVEGVRKGCVAVFGSVEEGSGTERIVVVAETRETAPEKQDALRRLISEAAADILETPPDEVVLAGPQSVPKTSSGKIRRAATKELFESGRLSAGKRAVWWQLARLGMAGAFKRGREKARSLAEQVWGCWFWALMLPLGAVCWLLLLVGPTLRFRIATFRYGCRLLFKLTGVPLKVEGLENLPESGCVLVSNHASYLDVMVLAAGVPGELIAVGKKELEKSLLLRILVNRTGAMLVDRADMSASVAASRQALELAQRGRRLLVFPEGTFTREPGLLMFRLGAFTVAAQAGLKVVPLAVRGSRTLLREDDWLPRRARLSIRVGPPIEPGGWDFQAAVRLRDAARAFILDHCGEPDRGGEYVLFGSGSTIERVGPD